MLNRWKVLRGRHSCSARGYFGLYYAKGTTVEALPGTLGIMVFDTWRHAADFMGRNRTIIMVKAIGQGKNCPLVSGWTDEFDLKRFYAKEQRFVAKIKPPLGTICYPAVEVLG